MSSIGFYCDASSIEQNALEQLQLYVQQPYVDAVCALLIFTIAQKKRCR